MKRHTFYFLAILSIVLCACGTSRRSFKATTTADTVTVTIHDTFTHYRDRIEKVYVHDTTIVTPAAQTKQTLNPGKMIPGQPYTTNSGNVRSTVKKDSLGNITAECEADSLKIVIRTLTERTISQAEQLKHLTMASTDKKSYTESTYKESYVKAKSWFGRNWKWLSVLTICLFLVELVYRKILK